MTAENDSTISPEKDAGTTWQTRFACLLFHGVTITAVLVVLLPVVLYPFTSPFQGKAAGAILFIAACVERMWAMYLRQGLGRTCSSAGKDWTATAVGYAYTLTLGASIAEFMICRQSLGPLPMIAGFTVYAAGVALRYWAFHALRNQWHVDVSDTNGVRYLVREGPYRFIRHPLYLGACMEIIGLPVFFGAWGSLIFGALIFIPLEISRAYYEERFLRELFGTDYRLYKNEVWGFIPLPFKPSRHS